jgi:putative aldouronate transport system substrate-binding protein
MGDCFAYILICYEKIKGGNEMNKNKKILAILICMTMLIGMLTACGNNSGEETNTTDETSQNSGDAETTNGKIKVDFSEHKEYTWWQFPDTYDYYSDYSQNPVVQYLNKKFNMTLKYIHPAKGSEQDALSVMMASGEYTDLIEPSYYRGSISQLYKDGVIIDITKYLDYMPNMKSIMDSDPGYKKVAYNDDGQILRLPIFSTTDSDPWAGLMYRADILNTMTGGNPKFPSGDSEPTTIEDWEYILPLFKQYFEKAGFKDYAPLIIPSNGIFYYGDLLTGFGAAASYYVEDDKVKFGPVQDGFYNYLVKMKEWYNKGYIYKDFATRTNDRFYLPNPALVYGGAAGIWYSIQNQLGTALSVPDKGLNVEVKALKNPIDTAHDITAAPVFIATSKYESTMGSVVTTNCKDVERLLTSLDYLYSEEGGMIKSYGLTGEAAAENEIYKKAGLEDGTYYIDENGKFHFNEKVQKDPTLLENWNAFFGLRLPGLAIGDYHTPDYNDEKQKAYDTWTYYNDKSAMKNLPANIYRTPDEDKKYTDNQTKIDDYINTMVPKFILGGTELNEQTWQQFKNQLEQYGLSENISINQTAYDRYLKR